jgi:hypothetical protein
MVCGLGSGSNVLEECGVSICEVEVRVEMFYRRRVKGSS